MSSANEANYVPRAVKIEAGAKTALDPHSARTLTPYVTPALADTRFGGAEHYYD
jgi:hypothetical protein